MTPFPIRKMHEAVRKMQASLLHLTRPETLWAIARTAGRYSVIRPPANPDNCEVVTVPEAPVGAREKITERPVR
jgi:hypothetical protein